MFMRFSRRDFLASSGLLLPGCAARRTSLGPAVPAPTLARVKVSPDRVIRMTAGLRPYRPSGFVVRGQKLGDKTVIHNYGHGGAGITLSWGTAQLAVEEASKTEVRDCAVLGCGVVGLSTARLLQLRGYNPVIYAREMPPSTTSNVAGGLWEPVSLFDESRVTPEFRRQFGEASRFAFRRYQSLTGDVYGVRWLPLYQLSTSGEITPPSPANPASDIDSLYPETRRLTKTEHPFDVPYVQRRYSMLIEPAIYLNALVRDFLLNSGLIVIREFHTLEEIAALRQSLIFNCTGLGAGALFQDAEVMPIKGQLVVLLPQPEVDYMTIGPAGSYMFPRHDGIVLGGSFERGVANTEINPAITTRILEGNGTLFGSMRS